MGVRGLTSFIAKNADQYLRPFELHDCNLVIDGDSLACNLYKDVSQCNSAFGGDYDEYYRTVINFFHLLQQCNIRSFVLMDGGYEQKKIRTIEKRLRGKICIIKCIDPTHSKRMFPIMMRETFINAIKDSMLITNGLQNIQIMRCIYEADDELAALAKKLNCPLLSYDSDFYIHNVKYIPSITLTMRILYKKVKANQVQQSSSSPILKQCEVRHLNKRKQMNCGHEIETISHQKHKNHKSKCKMIKYLDCCIYETKNLIEKGSLSQDKLPIFAALLGNDYIECKVFKKFYSHHVTLRKMNNKKVTQLQKRIIAMLKWLKYETKESALNKILCCMQANDRTKLLSQLELATEGYLNEKCISFDYFQLNGKDCIRNLFKKNSNTEGEEEENGQEEEEDSGQEEVESGQEEVESGEEEEEESCSEEEEESGQEEEKESGSEEEEESVQEDEEENTLNNTKSNNEDKNLKENIHPKIPDWLCEKIYSAELPRFFSDLLSLRLYINNPQIENFLLPDCNEIAIPILLKIYALLHYPHSPKLRYLTRVQRLTNVTYKTLTPPLLPEFSTLNHKTIDIQHIQQLFSLLPIDSSKLFQNLNKLPINLQLYFLAIIYWSHQSSTANIHHLHSILLCLTVIQIIDSKIEPIRKQNQFQKVFGKLIRKERLTREKIRTSQQNETKEQMRLHKKQELLVNLLPYEKIPFISKIECILVQENCLKFYNFIGCDRSHHNEHTTTIVHSFSEFQAVIYQMLSLNALINYPLNTIQMEQFYNGVFLYNIYSKLIQCPDVLHYIENYFFQDSQMMFEYFNELFRWCLEFVPFKIENLKLSKKSFKKKQKVLKKQKKSKQNHLNSEILVNDEEDDMIDRNEDGSETDNYFDINNRFSQMLIK